MSSLIRMMIVSAVAVSLAGCAPRYSLVKPAPTQVAANSLQVQPSRSWNRAPRSRADIDQLETWTQNGLSLDSINFIGGLEDGASVAREHKDTDQKVPVFRKSMTPQDLVSMLESYYRIRGVSVFETVGVKPVTFVGENGVQFDYEFVAADEVRRRGRAVMAISQGKLYLINLNAAAVHYFGAALSDFEALVASAQAPGRKG